MYCEALWASVDLNGIFWISLYLSKLDLPEEAISLNKFNYFLSKQLLSLSSRVCSNIGCSPMVEHLSYFDTVARMESAFHITILVT